LWSLSIIWCPRNVEKKLGRKGGKRKTRHLSPRRGKEEKEIESSQHPAIPSKEDLKKKREGMEIFYRLPNFGGVREGEGREPAKLITPYV